MSRKKAPGQSNRLQIEAFLQLNAKLLWPGTFAFVEWLGQRKSCIDGRRIIELGSLMGSILVMVGLYILLWCKSMETQNQNQERVTKLYQEDGEIMGQEPQIQRIIVSKY